MAFDLIEGLHCTAGYKLRHILTTIYQYFVAVFWGKVCPAYLSFGRVAQPIDYCDVWLDGGLGLKEYIHEFQISRNIMATCGFG